jgi:enoyl-[acyl-carrier protein] reductase/trans-2-enoyl-CoA reductase (NAD+)
VVIKPLIRNNICLTSHPTGCALQVGEQIDYAREKTPLEGPKRSVVIGSATGYGLASRIVAAFGYGSSTLGLSFEKPGRGTKSGTAGWYNTRSFEEQAGRSGLEAWSINGDAFSTEIKKEAVALIKEKMGPIDLLIYSLASPRRRDPRSGEVFTSVIKPIGSPCVYKTVDFQDRSVSQVALGTASEQEIDSTVRVMGGEDWELWIETLEEEGLISDVFTTVAFSYIGPELTYPIYRSGTIGMAKKHLENTAESLHKRLSGRGGRALISVNRAVVTRAAAIIPAIPLYISLLYRVLKDRGLHEGCIEQMRRLFKDNLYTDNPDSRDEEGRIRLDGWEMGDDTQEEILKRYERVSSRNLRDLADVDGFWDDFLKLNGFGVDGVDYEDEVEV